MRLPDGHYLPAHVDGEYALPSPFPLSPQSQERGALLPDVSLALGAASRIYFGVQGNKSLLSAAIVPFRPENGGTSDLPSHVFMGEAQRHCACPCGR